MPGGSPSRRRHPIRDGSSLAQRDRRSWTRANASHRKSFVGGSARVCTSAYGDSRSANVKPYQGEWFHQF